MSVLWGFIRMMFTESFPTAPKWTTDQIPDLTGKVIIVTRGNSGIGLEATKVLVKHGAKVYIFVRSKKNADKALSEIENETGKKARYIPLDLADLDSVQAAAEEFLRNESRLDVLFNSGGVMIPPIDQVSKQGYDLQFAVNVLGHFYLTKLLLPTILSTGKARVIFVSSGAHHLSGIDYKTLRPGPARTKKGADGLYAQSKFATVALSAELARRYDDEGIVSLAINPGNVATNLQREVTGLKKKSINWMLHPIVPNGIVTHLYAGTATELDSKNGAYLVPWARIGTPRYDTQDPKIGEELWRYLEEQVAGRM